MRKTILVGVFALAGSAAIMSAQSQNAPPAAPPDASQSPQATAQATSTARANTLTIQGCVEKGAGAASATPGATGTSGASAYVLSNAMRPTGTSGSAAGATASIAPSYRLDADDAKLSGHVGHKVEITGTLDLASASGSGSASGSAATAASAPRLKVESVKMIAAMCP